MVAGALPHAPKIALVGQRGAKRMLKGWEPYHSDARRTMDPFNAPCQPAAFSCMVTRRERSSPPVAAEP